MEKEEKSAYLVDRHHEGCESHDNERGSWRQSSLCFLGSVSLFNVVYYYKFDMLSAIANLAAFAILDAMALPHQVLRQHTRASSTLVLQFHSSTDRLLDILREYPTELACCDVSVWDVHRVVVCQGDSCRMQRVGRSSATAKILAHRVFRLIQIARERCYVVFDSVPSLG